MYKYDGDGDQVRSSQVTISLYQPSISFNSETGVLAVSPGRYTVVGDIAGNETVYTATSVYLLK